ncbi:class I SAM-dependent methyltransferase [Dokdonella immobilis]|uniref:Methyltransferase domain-containing protein n=1 Tax=Dokdonella immobilis TaxID=578942 RepID=A0A1I4V658_9GAMM|nr:class I SAM-dependent methyltransferase [Dokdonella immobilis]SFM96704.1 Methyltransferase domain-containing protein [Dokdonella immobilis]
MQNEYSSGPLPEWDYSRLAVHYERRAPYHPSFVALAAEGLGLQPGQRVADIGSGTGRVALAFASAGYVVDAVEPCVEMARIGLRATQGANVSWHGGCAEETGLSESVFDVVSFGSSLNVVDAARAVPEAARVLKSHGALVIVYNYRDKTEALQREIERAIRTLLPDFDPGARSQDPTAIIESGKLFRVRQKLQLPLVHSISPGEFVDGFRAHATLVRQAGNRLQKILDELGRLSDAWRGADGKIRIPFSTHMWLAEARH